MRSHLLVCPARLDAIHYDRGVMTLAPDEARSRAEDHYYAGLDQLAAGDAPGAAASFRASLAADPRFLDAQHGLIRALQDAGAFDEAISVANALAETSPDDVLAHTALSILYQHKGMVPEAEQAATRAKLLGWKQQLRAGAQAGGSE